MSGSHRSFRPIRRGSYLRQRRAPEVGRGRADRASRGFFGWHLADESRRECVAGPGSGGIPAHPFRRRAASAPAKCSNAGVRLQPQAEARVGGTRPKGFWKQRKESYSRDGRPSRIPHPAPPPVARSKPSISRQGPRFRDSARDGFSDAGRGRRVFPAVLGAPGRCEWFRCARAV